MTDKTIESIATFTRKWCPAGQHDEFLKSLYEVLQVAVTEATHYMVQPEMPCKHTYSYALYPAGRCTKCGAHD